MFLSVYTPYSGPTCTRVQRPKAEKTLVHIKHTKSKEILEEDIVMVSTYIFLYI